MAWPPGQTKLQKGYHLPEGECNVRTCAFVQARIPFCYIDVRVAWEDGAHNEEGGVPGPTKTPSGVRAGFTPFLFRSFRLQVGTPAAVVLAQSRQGFP